MKTRTSLAFDAMTGTAGEVTARSTRFGTILSGRSRQPDLFDTNVEQFQRMRSLDEVVDRINRLQGSETIVLGAQQYTSRDKDGNAVGKANVFANANKHDYRSPNPTTRWSDIIRLK